jgi:hypothetical protein
MKEVYHYKTYRHKKMEFYTHEVDRPYAMKTSLMRVNFSDPCL